MARSTIDIRHVAHGKYTFNDVTIEEKRTGLWLRQSEHNRGHLTQISQNVHPTRNGFCETSEWMIFLRPLGTLCIIVNMYFEYTVNKNTENYCDFCSRVTILVQSMLIWT